MQGYSQKKRFLILVVDLANESCQRVKKRVDVSQIIDKRTTMKTLTKEIWMDVPQRRAIISIHNEVERLVAESGVKDGLVLVNTTQI